MDKENTVVWRENQPARAAATRTPPHTPPVACDAPRMRHPPLQGVGSVKPGARCPSLRPVQRARAPRVYKQRGARRSRRRVLQHNTHKHGGCSTRPLAPATLRCTTPGFTTFYSCRIAEPALPAAAHSLHSHLPN
ncbi:hypothetical protein RR46_01827 [Papilio xuthus]|uniref:Uncharacterized protein n=1 Tax=Papilio xuthus TaxID=66420 RepID=A0A194QFZ5_PAPXU|nr:hypothetical protein RR46_01827 [Papilio xuthus]